MINIKVRLWNARDNLMRLSLMTSSSLAIFSCSRIISVKIGVVLLVNFHDEVLLP